MDFLDSVVKKMEETKVDLKLKSEVKEHLSIVKLSPSIIDNWEYRDRQDCELGDIDELADSIQLKGQAQPIIVVKSTRVFNPKSNMNAKYVVIAGYRRWLACKSRNINVEAIVRDMDFDQAVGCLVAENEKEKVSDYSKGLFFYNLLKSEKVKKKILYERLGFKKTAFDNYLSFAEVPSDVWDAVGNMAKVSARTSATIKQICAKGAEEIKAIISIADKISEGIGEKKIKALVDNILKGGGPKKKVTRVSFSEKITLDISNNSLKVRMKNLSRDEESLLADKISSLLKGFSDEVS